MYPEQGFGPWVSKSGYCEGKGAGQNFPVRLRAANFASYYVEAVGV